MAIITNGKQSIKVTNVTETENVDANVTQYTIEEGSPLSDHTQRTGKGISVEGFFLGSNATNDYKTLMSWQDNGVELTYKGRIYHTKLLLSGLSKNYNNYGNGFGVSFRFVVIQKAKTSWKKKTNKGKQQVKKPVVKANPAVYVTVKSGDTYWGWWKKYGTAIQTLRNWNKWPDRFIPIGKRARVK